jgi:hypothetical protein
MSDNHDDLQLQAHEIAWRRFTTIYRTENPAPARENAQRGNWFIKFLLFVLLVAAVITGAWHTVPTVMGGKPEGFNEWVRALAIMTSIDLGIFLLAYIFIQNRILHLKEGEDTIRHVNFLLKIALGLALSVALGANLYDTLHEWGYTFEPLTLVVSVLIGASSPLQAWVVGDAFSSLVAQDSLRQRHADAVYKQELKFYDDTRKALWEEKKEGFTRRAMMELKAPASVPRLTEGALSAQNRQTDTDRQQTTQTQRQTASGYNKASNARDKARVFLAANPGLANRPLRELADMIGVKKDTVSAVINEMGLRSVTQDEDTSETPAVNTYQEAV